MDRSFKERSEKTKTGTGSKKHESVRQRVEQTETRITDAESMVQKQAAIIESLKSTQSELIHTIAVFESRMKECLAIEVEKISKDMRIKHSVLKAKNKQLSDLVVEQKAEKSLLMTQVVELDTKLANLEDSVGI